MEELICCLQLREDQKPIVTTPSGRLTGRLRETSKGVDYIAFTCIPYAEPPIGKCNFFIFFCSFFPTIFDMI